MKKLILILLSVLPIFSHASSDIQTKAVGVGIHGDGRISLKVEDTIDEQNCPMKRIDLMPSHKYHKEILSVMLAAAAMKASISVKTNGCTPGYSVPTLNETDGTWIFIIQ